MPRCRRICAASASRRGSELMATHDDDRGDPRRHGRDRWARDDNVVVFGEDVGYFGGVFRCTAGPAAEIRQDPLLRRADQRSRHRRRGDRHGAPTACAPASRSSSPTTCIRPTTRSSRRPRACAIARPASSPARSSVRMPTGGGIFGGQTHSQSPEALFTHVSGLKTVVPSNPYDAKGLLIAAIEDPDPVIFLEPKRLYNGPFDGHHDRPVTPWSKHALGEVPDGHYTRAARQGGDPARGLGRDRPRLRHHGACRARPRPRRPASTPRSSTCARLLPLDLETIVASVEEDRPLRRSCTRRR